MGIVLEPVASGDARRFLCHDLTVPLREDDGCVWDTCTVIMAKRPTNPPAVSSSEVTADSTEFSPGLGLLLLRPLLLPPLLLLRLLLRLLLLLLLHPPPPLLLLLRPISSRF
jgi:hypothetical protein